MHSLKQVRPDELPEVLRLASELYAQDRAAIERAQECDHVQAAAAEAGLPPEYLERAAARIQEQRGMSVRTPRRRGRRLAMAASILAFTVGALMALGTARTHSSAPADPPTAARPNLMGANLSGASLAGQDLSRSDLQAANLAGASLHRTNLSGSDLMSANLSGADLRHADLSGADLQGADLSRANLAGANLTGADLMGANLRGANLTGTIIAGVDLQGADLAGARYDVPTTADSP